jgi:hypothetical protein
MFLRSKEERTGRMGDSLEATAVLPDVAQAPVEKVVAYIRYIRTFTCRERLDFTCLVGQTGSFDADQERKFKVYCNFSQSFISRCCESGWIAVLRIRDVHPGYQIQIFLSRIKNSGSRIRIK